MIDSNLAVLLAERNLRITKVSKDTGISRTTLTALCNDYTGGIKFDVLNTLCKYLDVTPAEFFNYSSYEYELKLIDESWTRTPDYLFELSMNISRKGMTWKIPLSGNAIPPNEGLVHFVNAHYDLPFEYEKDDAIAYTQFQLFKADVGLRKISSIKDEIEKLIQGRVDYYLKKSKMTKDRIPDKIIYTFNTRSF